MSCFKDENRLNEATFRMCNSLSIDLSEIQSDEDKVRVFIRFWTSMMSKFKDVVDKDNVIVIESSELFSDPIRVLLNIASKTNHHLTPNDIHTIQDKWIDNHSKFGTSFTYQDRLDIEQATYNKHKELFNKFDLDQIQEQYNLTVK